jgi:hypothetical protein
VVCPRGRRCSAPCAGGQGGTWDLARSAYIADLDTDADAPDAFIGWLQRALIDYAGLGPLRRAELAASIVQDPVAGRGFSKAFPLQVEVVQALEQAIIDDRRELGRVVSRAGFVREAVTHAAQRARQRLGRDLPPGPGPPAHPPALRGESARTKGDGRRLVRTMSSRCPLRCSHRPLHAGLLAGVLECRFDTTMELT